MQEVMSEPSGKTSGQLSTGIQAFSATSFSNTSNSVEHKKSLQQIKLKQAKDQLINLSQNNHQEVIDHIKNLLQPKLSLNY